MAVLARSGLVHRLVGAVRRGRTPIVLGGPGTGKTTVARAADAQLAPGVGVIELPEDEALDLEALEEVGQRPYILVGGLELHRSLEAQGPACRIAGRTVQRFPLVPLTRRSPGYGPSGVGRCQQTSSSLCFGPQAVIPP